MSHPEFIDLPPLLEAQGNVELPGSKSISNRVLLLSALARYWPTELRDVLLSDDTERMLDGLRVLGVGVEQIGEYAFRVQGCDGKFPVKDAELFLGNAGTAFRPLTAVLALSGGHYIFKGVPRMHERPIGDLVDALRQLGADIRYLGKEGFPPLEIFPATFNGVSRISVRGDLSSQFLSALLLTLPLLDAKITVEVVGELISKPYIEITLAMMAHFGVAVQRNGWHSFTVEAGSFYKSPRVMYVERDASSASYFLAAGAIGGGPVCVFGLGSDSIQGDVRFADALAQMGAQIEYGTNLMTVRAPLSGRLKAIDMDCNHIPDAAMTLAVAALFAEGTTTLKNIASWRVKETDRIAAMATELRKVGAAVEEGADYIRITPPAVIKHAAIDTYDDHRMAMCFSLAAFGPEGIRINDPACVAKTFPDYFERFNQIVTPVPVIAIDGPSASGKGTVAQIVASRLGFHYLDSGALYRLLALAAERGNVPLDDEAKLAELALQMDIRFEGDAIFLGGDKVGDELRTEETGGKASKVAALPAVRAALLDKQRAFRRAPGLVTDGRDMGSVVFPDASLKVFLTATAEVRAERRHKQLTGKGLGANITALLLDIRTRDERDSQRGVAPLQQAPGAGLLDTSDLNIEQAVSEVLARYRA